MRNKEWEKKDRVSTWTPNHELWNLANMMFSSLVSHTSVRTRRAVTCLICATTDISRYSDSALLGLQEPGQ